MVTFCSAVFLVLCVLNTFSEIRETCWDILIGLNFTSFIRNDEKSDFLLIHRFDLYMSKYDKCLPKKKKLIIILNIFLQVKMELEHLLVHKDWQHCGRCLSTRNIVKQHARFCRRPGCRVPDCESLR